MSARTPLQGNPAAGGHTEHTAASTDREQGDLFDSGERVLSQVPWRRRLGQGPCAHCGDPMPGVTRGWKSNCALLKALAPLYRIKKISTYSPWLPYYADHLTTIKTRDGLVFRAEPYAESVPGSRLVGVGNQFGRDVKYLRSLGWKVTASIEGAQHAVPNGTIAISFVPPVGHTGPPTFREHLLAQIEKPNKVGDIARELVADQERWHGWDGTPEILRAWITDRIASERTRLDPRRYTEAYWNVERLDLQLKALDKFIATWNATSRGGPGPSTDSGDGPR